jgi:hypothetical protein
LGRASYAAMYTVAVSATRDTVVQAFSRATIFATSLISILMLILMFFRKQVDRKDVAIGASGLAWYFAGYFFLVLGERGLQMVAVMAGVPVGYFGGMKRKWPAIMLLVLTATSVSLPMHYSFSLSAGYWILDPAAAEAATFMGSRSDVAASHPFFMETSSSFVLISYVMNYRESGYWDVRSYLYTETYSPESPGFQSTHHAPRAHAPYGYVEVTVGIRRDIRLGLANLYTPAIDDLPNSAKYNRVMDYGVGVWNKYVG